MIARHSRPSMFLGLAVLLVMAVGAAVSGARADTQQLSWMSIAEAVGFGGGRTATALSEVATFMARLPEPPAGTVELGAHAGSEGHWIFLNRRGESFTVGTPGEMTRVVPALAPDAPLKARVTLHLSGETVFERTAILAELPAEVSRRVLAAGRSYPLVRAGLPGSQTLRVAVRPRLHIEIGVRAAFDEAVRQLDRPLDKGRMRTLALTPGGPDTLVRHAKPDAATGRPLPDPIDPSRLLAALSAFSGQTAILSGRISDKLLAFRPRTGPEQTLNYSDLTQAAARAGIDLLIVQSSTPYQPGGRTWLWQRFEIDGLDKALQRATLADALETLAGAREVVQVGLSEAGPDRVVMRAGPPQAFQPGAGEGIGGVLQEVTTSLTGSVVPTAVELHLASSSRRRELGLRLLPMVPSSLQATYLVLLAVGLVGGVVAWRWWGRLWPAESRADYSGAIGYRAAETFRLVVFLGVFLPLAALPALLVTLAGIPRLAYRRLLGRPSGPAGSTATV